MSYGVVQGYAMNGGARWDKQRLSKKGYLICHVCILIMGKTYDAGERRDNFKRKLHEKCEEKAFNL